jgi:hypothetical protein
VQTGLLQTSEALSAGLASDLLALVPGERVRTWERPIRHASSPEVLTGVDCHTPTTSRARVRVVGTVASQVSLTAGHLLQSATRVDIQLGRAGRRHPWSYYLAKPGVAELLGSAQAEDLAAGFLDGTRTTTTLDLASVSEHFMSMVQRSRALDRKPPFRGVSRTTLRWAASQITDRDKPSIVFTLVHANLRTVRLFTESKPNRDIAELCADLALHDWLLSTLDALVDRARIGHNPTADVLRGLRPAVDHLLHAWMPGARLADDLSAFWDELNRRPGLSRQWEATVARIRDQLAVGTIEALQICRSGGEQSAPQAGSVRPEPTNT